MKYLIVGVGLVLLLATPAFAREQSILVRITGYWRSEGCGQHAASNGARLRAGHCAVDPKKIPYGSTIVFPDTECVAVDTGPAVVSRKSARYCGRTVAQKNALVIDRFFETKRDAVLWTNAHPQFITVRVITPESKRQPPLPQEKKLVAAHSEKGPVQSNSVLIAAADSNPLIRTARRRN
jgi:3D (Asp-Asp-Asp) domain-containing protein